MNKKIKFHVLTTFTLLIFLFSVVEKKLAQTPCCAYPTTETSGVDGISSVYPSATRFNMTIGDSQSPPTVFDGRQVREFTAAPGPNDCWYQGAPFDATSGVSGGTWTVAGGQVSGQSNHWGWDVVGWKPIGIIYVRDAASQNLVQLPCTSRVHQGMEMDSCPVGSGTGWQTYIADNLLSQTIYLNFVINCRVSVCHSINF